MSKPSNKPYAKVTELKPTTLALFLEYAKDAGNWSGTPLVNGNVGSGFGDIGRLSHMKMAGLVTTSKTREKINEKMMNHSWVEFTDSGVELAAKNGIKIEGIRHVKADDPEKEPKVKVPKVKAEKKPCVAKTKKETLSEAS